MRGRTNTHLYSGVALNGILENYKVDDGENVVNGDFIKINPYYENNLVSNSQQEYSKVFTQKIDDNYIFVIVYPSGISQDNLFVYVYSIKDKNVVANHTISSYYDFASGYDNIVYFNSLVIGSTFGEAFIKLEFNVDNLSFSEKKYLYSKSNGDDITYVNYNSTSFKYSLERFVCHKYVDNNIIVAIGVYSYSNNNLTTPIYIKVDDSNSTIRTYFLNTNPLNVDKTNYIKLNYANSNYSRAIFCNNILYFKDLKKIFISYYIKDPSDGLGDEFKLTSFDVTNILIGSAVLCNSKKDVIYFNSQYSSLDYSSVFMGMYENKLLLLRFYKDNNSYDIIEIDANTDANTRQISLNVPLDFSSTNYIYPFCFTQVNGKFLIFFQNIKNLGYDVEKIYDVMVVSFLYDDTISFGSELLINYIRVYTPSSNKILSAESSPFYSTNVVVIGDKFYLCLQRYKNVSDQDYLYLNIYDFNVNGDGIGIGYEQTKSTISKSSGYLVNGVANQDGKPGDVIEVYVPYKSN